MSDQPSQTNRFREKLSVLEAIDPSCAASVRKFVQSIGDTLKPRTSSGDQADIRAFEVTNREGEIIVTIYVLLRDGEIIVFDMSPIKPPEPYQ